ncbi:hypothetical protein ABZX85_04935 [Streptomyces sp. NPDC004539]|uniref:hypothetical protein n=1 Tax=Streptomyces sp. NPDC004539 TaxID=3154280 RepID=UPI0033A1DAE7
MSTQPPADPDRHAREANEVARASHRTSTRITLWLGVPALVVSLVALIPVLQENDRNRKEADEKNAVAAGEPVKVSAGVSYDGPGWWVGETDHERRYDRTPFDVNSFDPAKPSEGWLNAHWTPLNSTGVAVNVLAEHEKTTLVQGVGISDLHCAAPLTGTLLQPPGTGDGGAEAVPKDMALNIEATRPVTRDLGRDELPGAPMRGQIALDQGDQREFVIRFFVKTRSCAFRAHLVISSGGKTYHVKIPAVWDSGGKAISDTFQVTAAAPRHAYGTHYISEGVTLRDTGAENIVWDEWNRPTYEPRN